MSVDWTAIRTDYENGLSLRQLASKYDVSKTYIIEKRNKEGWNRPTTDHRPPTTNQAQIDTNPTPKKSTKDTQRLFLEAFSEHAIVLVAARAAGIHRTTVYDWLEHDEDFGFAYNQAKEDAKDTLRAEIYRRAKEGVEEPLISQGQLVYEYEPVLDDEGKQKYDSKGKPMMQRGLLRTVRKYSDTLLIFHAKMLMPEYREKQSLDGNTPAQAQGTQALYDAVERILEPYPEEKWKLAEAIAELGKTSKA